MDWPSVSVIVPFFNGKKFCKRFLLGLETLVYPGKYEVIFVDNMSSDGSPLYLENKGSKVIKYNEFKSSYGARNMGVMASRGEILAFTDIDCKVSPDWLLNGVKELILTNSDLIAGKVTFEFKNNRSPWEVLDAIVNMDNELSVKQGCAKTANLFVKRDVFKKIGMFNDRATSGEDVLWTKKASAASLKLRFCASAEVLHPTRGALEKIKKDFRVGRGLYRKYRGKGNLLFFKSILRGALPPRIEGILQRGRAKGLYVDKRKLLAVAWVASSLQSLGQLFAFFREDP